MGKRRYHYGGYYQRLFLNLKPLGQVAHRKVLKDFMLYVAVGGMPQAVIELIESNDFRALTK